MQFSDHLITNEHQEHTSALSGRDCTRMCFDHLCMLETSTLLKMLAVTVKAFFAKRERKTVTARRSSVVV